MVRSDHLRATSLQAEVSYLKDLKRVGDSKRKESQHRAALRHSERTFWSETLRAKTHNLKATANSPHPSAALSIQLERMRDAHGRLQHASSQHTSAERNLHKELQQLSSSQQRLEALQKLLVRAARERANRIESRLSDEINDLVSSANRRLRSNCASALESNSIEQPARAIPGQIQESLLSSRGTPDQGVSQISLSVESRAYQSLQATRPVVPEPVPHSIQLQNASMQAVDGRTSLSVSCAVGRAGTLAMSLVKEQSGNLTVRLDPGLGALLPTLLRERSQIQAKLQSMGLKVTTIDVSGPDSTTLSLSRQSRRARMEDDEDIIA